jgi:hypothetical protein
MSRRDNEILILLGLKAAFHSVLWNIFMETQADRCCPPISKSLIMSLICRPVNLLLIVNQSNISAIKTSKGVYQGGGISALIFVIYIDPFGDTPPKHLTLPTRLDFSWWVIGVLLGIK